MICKMITPDPNFLGTLSKPSSKPLSKSSSAQLKTSQTIVLDIPMLGTIQHASNHDLRNLDPIHDSNTISQIEKLYHLTSLEDLELTK